MPASRDSPWSPEIIIVGGTTVKDPDSDRTRPSSLPHDPRPLSQPPLSAGPPGAASPLKHAHSIPGGADGGKTPGNRPEGPCDGPESPAERVAGCWHLIALRLAVIRHAPSPSVVVAPRVATPDGTPRRQYMRGCAQPFPGVTPEHARDSGISFRQAGSSESSHSSITESKDMNLKIRSTSHPAKG